MANGQKVKIDTEFITLGQFLKHADIIQSGGMAKWFLAEHEIYVNDEAENRRGKKLRENDVIEIKEIGKFTIAR
ncbi:S4 domain-containing protein YaaA [Metabacillus sp. GX 13764]|uniref:S4 domain-containing protein YaaA n=1 Tax=Metabacillus kandeliae TaxID=2900151 RepID=UPI001E473FFC|nr:S4 domain-containing protein YaaA [Metabacillus kandeliae]MCD7035278.1 S4 domain-containing protein YaaA [Metabacillus kandeliae]